MITAVFFDLYGTLAGFNPSRYDIQSDACAQFGITVTEEGVLKGYAAADAFMAAQNAVQPLRALDRQARIDFFSEYERRVLAGSSVEVSPERAHQIWLRIREMPYEMRRFDDVLPALEQLKERGLTLGLISNMNEDGATLTESMGLSTVLDFAVTSAEVGSEKPHPPIFLAALEHSGARPDQAVHVGDQITSDIDGASNVGIRPILLDRDRNHADITRCPRIETLSELPALLDEF
jgi:putative hydrolase of the HAD superfamily